MFSNSIRDRPKYCKISAFLSKVANRFSGILDFNKVLSFSLPQSVASNNRTFNNYPPHSIRCCEAASLERWQSLLVVLLLEQQVR